MVTTHSAHRKAFGPRRHNGHHGLALDIAHSILEHRDAGRYKRIAEYTRNRETQLEVCRWLDKLCRPVQSEEAQTLRREQQAWLDRSTVRGMRK